MKTTASEFKKFIDDDESLMDDDSAVVVIKDGAVFIPARHAWEKDKTCTLDYFFRKWRKRNHVD